MKYGRINNTPVFIMEKATRKLKLTNNLIAVQSLKTGISYIVDKDQVEDNGLDIAKHEQDIKEHQDKMTLDEKKLSETIRSNKEKEKIARKNKQTAKK